jgi:hypothetical protein
MAPASALSLTDPSCFSITRLLVPCLYTILHLQSDIPGWPEHSRGRARVKAAHARRFAVIEP